MVWPACIHYMDRAPGCIQSSAKRAQGFAFHSKSFYVCEWIEQIAMKYLNAQLWSHIWDVKCQIMALVIQNGRILFRGKPVFKLSIRIFGFSTISSSLCMHFGGFSPFLCQQFIFHLYSSSLSMLFSSNRNIFTCKLIPSVLPHCKASPCRGSACLMEFRATGGKLQPSGVPGFHTVDQAGRPLPTGHGFF